MKEKYSWLTKNDLSLLENMRAEKIKDWYVNQFHLTGYSGAVSEPVGLVFWEGYYWIFIEGCPYSSEKLNQSWTLFKTKDFINYYYEGIAVTPSSIYDGQGILGGNAYISNGELSFYYTGQVIKNNNYLNPSGYTLKFWIDFDKKIVTKKSLFEIDSISYTGHYRAPLVFTKFNTTYMLVGAQTDKKEGVIEVSVSKDDNKEIWNKINYWSWNDLDKYNFYMLESPMYLNLNRNDYICFSGEQIKPIVHGGHRVYYQWGILDQIGGFSRRGELELLDYGLDFTSAHNFKNSPNREIIMGTLSNPFSNFSKTYKYEWNGQLTIPREIWADYSGKLFQRPIREMIELRDMPLKMENNSIIYKDGIVEIIADKLIQNNWGFMIQNEKNEQLTVSYFNQILIINRTQMTYTDSFNLPFYQKIPIENIHHFQLLIDRSCCELFINNGEYAISIQFFVNMHNEFKTNINQITAYQLKGININSNTTIFDNIQWDDEPEEPEPFPYYLY